MTYIKLNLFNLNNFFNPLYLKILLILLISTFFKPNFAEAYNNSGENQKIRLAVLDFEANNVSLYAAKAVSEFINTEMSKKQEFTIVERNRLNQILMEHELFMTGAFDTSTAIEVGKLVIADKILIGTLTKTGNVFVISARVVDVNTGKIELSESERFLREENMELASRILAIKIINKLANTSYSAPVRTYLQYDERNRFAAGLYYKSGILPKISVPIVKHKNGQYYLTDTKQKIYIQSAVLALSYEFTESLGLRLDFKYTFLTATEKKPPHFSVDVLSVGVGEPEFKGYGLSINSMFRFPLSGFSFYLVPGLGISKYSQYDDESILVTSEVHYNKDHSTWGTYKILSSDHVYTYFAKLELGVAAYISKYVEFYLALGVDYHFFSKLIKDIRFHQTYGTEYNLMEKLPIQNKYSGNMPPEFYVMAGLTFRIF